MEQVFEAWIIWSIALGYFLGNVLVGVTAFIVKTIANKYIERHFYRELDKLTRDAEGSTETKTEAQ